MHGRLDWLQTLAHEHCEHCLQSFALELEVRCVGCDGPLCAFCQVTVRTSVHCADCAELANADDATDGEDQD